MNAKLKKEALLFAAVTVFMITVLAFFGYALVKGVVMVPFG